MSRHIRSKLKSLNGRELSERRQVGDAESMINEGLNASGYLGFCRVYGSEV